MISSMVQKTRPSSRAESGEPAARTSVVRVSKVALLTAGRDKHYALGLASALLLEDVSFDLIGSQEIVTPELSADPRVRVLNLRDQRPDVTPGGKAFRVLVYYWRLIRYTATTEARLFHILWNNKFEHFDRTLLMLYYKFMGKRVAFTAHNVNAGERDASDSRLNRLSLKSHYSLSDHIFVHTQKMKRELVSGFHVSERKVSVIPYGINNVVPNTTLSNEEAKQQLGLARTDKTLLFFGNIAPYKGLEYLITAFMEVAAEDASYRLIVAGAPKWSDRYWKQVQSQIENSGVDQRIIQSIKYISDEETEIYFKGADVFVLPYTHIFQSGVLFLGYSFGLPVIASDVGSLREEVIEGRTGFICKPQDSSDLAATIRRYFASDLYCGLENRRTEIKAYANESHSWSKVARITTAVYLELLH